VGGYETLEPRRVQRDVNVYTLPKKNGVKVIKMLTSTTFERGIEQGVLEADLTRACPVTWTNPIGGGMVD